jgi:nucleotide-binding universal stress UspA family protein
MLEGDVEWRPIMQPTVIVGYDGTAPGQKAVAEAAREAALRGAQLTVLTVSHRLPFSESMDLPAADAEEAVRKTAEDIALQGAEHAADVEPGVPVAAQVVAGYAGPVLAQAGHGATVLVVGSRGAGGFPGMLLGSVSMRVLAGACCPVIVVHGAETDGGHVPDGHAADGRVVAAVDIDEACGPVLDFAFAEAGRRGVGLSVIHVWDEPWILAYGQDDPGVADDIAAIVRERADRLAALVATAHRQWSDVQVFQQVATGSAAALLVAVASHAGLLVTGARRHGEGEHGMIVGPVMQTLLRHAECPVAVVPVD